MSGESGEGSGETAVIFLFVSLLCGALLKHAVSSSQCTCRCPYLAALDHVCGKFRGVGVILENYNTLPGDAAACWHLLWWSHHSRFK